MLSERIEHVEQIGLTYGHGTGKPPYGSVRAGFCDKSVRHAVSSIILYEQIERGLRHHSGRRGRYYIILGDLNVLKCAPFL